MCTAVFAEQNNLDHLPVGLAIQAFTDPNKTLRMSDAWQQQSIRYDDWAEQADIAVSLDQQLYPALLPLINAYARQHQLKISVQEGTCGISNKNLKDKSADITGFCCPPGEIDRFPGVRFHTLGVAAIALLVHPSNPLTSISLSQARQLYQGELLQWSEVEHATQLNVEDELIQVFGRLHCKQRPGHWSLLLPHEDQFSMRMEDLGTISDMVRNVSTRPYAVGYETQWMVARYRAQVGEVKSLQINGYAPSDEKALLAGHYPLYRSYNLTTWQDVNQRPDVEKLLAYLLSKVDQLDKKYGLISKRCEVNT